MQYAEKVEKAVCTCSASSRVGTRTSAEVALSFADAWRRQSMAVMEESWVLTSFCRIAFNTGKAYAAVLPEPVLARADPCKPLHYACRVLSLPSMSLPSSASGIASA